MEGTLEPPKKKKRKPCPRCGNFAKTTKLGARRLCVECLDRCDPIEREPILVTTLLSGGVALMARSSGGWIPIVVPMVVAQVALAVAFPDEGGPLIGGAVGVVATLIASSVRGELSDAVVSGTPLPAAGELLSRALARGWALFVGYLLMSFTVGLYSLLLVVPGILRALDLQLTLPIQVLEGTSPSESLRLSTERMQGFRATSFLTSLVVVVPVVLLLGMLFFALGTGNDILTIAVQTLVHLSGHLVPFITMALYLKLRWRAAREKLAPTTA
jgi:hypothetical protein